MANSFPFISDGPKQKDPNVRAIIRKQAMKDVGQARRKKRAAILRVDSKISPVVGPADVPFRSPASSSTGTFTSNGPENGDDYDELVPTQSLKLKRRPPPLMLPQEGPFPLSGCYLFSDYEFARSKFQLGIEDLTMLTNFHVGRSVIPILGADRENLASLLGHPRWSYLQFVPSRYGTKECVTAATNCLLAKVRSTLNPDVYRCQEITFHLYSKALKALQDAISMESAISDSDVLCATLLLSLFELLDPSRGDKAWVQHIEGSVRLVKARRPDDFVTEYDKALFAAHCGPLLTQALMDNTHCYLEEPKWTDKYLSLIQDSTFLNDRSALTIKIRCLMFPLPGLWADVREVVNSTQLFNDRKLGALKTRLIESQKGFLAWSEDYKNHCVRLSLASPSSQELALRRELFGTSLEGLILTKRLIATVCDNDREYLEIETQALAKLLLELQKHNANTPKYSWLFAGHEVGIAYTIIHTKNQWEGSYTYESDYERRIAIQMRFNVWSNLLKRFD